MADIPRGTDKSGDQPAVAPVGAPLDLHPPTPAAKQQAAKDLAKSDDKMVKANVLPPLPDFPGPESLGKAEHVKTYDANQNVLSDTATGANNSTGASDLRQVTQLDQSGATTQRETSWKDAQGKKHDVLEQNGVTTNTIKDGVSTDKLITRPDGSWEHDTIVRGKEAITKVGKDHTVSITDKNLFKGTSHEKVTHANGFTEDNVVDTRTGDQDLKTKDATGLLRFEHKVAAQTADGKFEYKSNQRWDAKGGVYSDNSHWKDKDGVYHEDNLINLEDRSRIHDVTTGESVIETDTAPDGTSTIIPLTSKRGRNPALPELPDH
jgi:hypothetical protein